MAKHKYIETPEALLELFKAYAKEVKASPFIVKDWVGGVGKEVLREKEKPLTLEGFNVYCFNAIGGCLQYFKNENNAYTEYLPICSHIKETIRLDQIQGGMAGIYNPSITQRLNGLVDKSENKTEHSGNINANFGNTLQPPPKSEDNP